MTREPLSQLDDWQLEYASQDIRGQNVLDGSGTLIGTVREMIVNTDVELVDAIVLDDGTEIPANDFELRDGAVYTRRAVAVEPVEAVEPVDTAPVREETGEVVVPIVEEELRVGKQVVEGRGIRIVRHVEEVPVNEQVTLRDETVDVHRRAVDRPVTEADETTFQQGTFEVRERDEEAVVDKQARVVEEVHIKKTVEDRTETIQDTVRRTDVDVENIQGGTRNNY